MLYRTIGTLDVPDGPERLCRVRIDARNGESGIKTDTCVRVAQARSRGAIVNHEPSEKPIVPPTEV